MVFIAIASDQMSFFLQMLFYLFCFRFGNDMLLWLPAYLTVKEHIYGEKVVNLLEDDTAQFSSEFASRSQYPQV